VEINPFHNRKKETKNYTKKRKILRIQDKLKAAPTATRLLLLILLLYPILTLSINPANVSTTESQSYFSILDFQKTAMPASDATLKVYEEKTRVTF
jgi:hypothetical protein